MTKRVSSLGGWYGNPQRPGEISAHGKRGKDKDARASDSLRAAHVTLHLIPCRTDSQSHPCVWLLCVLLNVPDEVIFLP